MDLLARTASLGLYDLREGSCIRWELAAYQAGLDLLEGCLRALETGASTDEMARGQLEQVCREREFFALDGIPDAALRKYAGLLSGPAPRAADQLERWLNGLGAEVTLLEQPEMRRVLVSGERLGGLVPELETLGRLLAALLPAGVSAAFDFGRLTWAMLEARGLTFDGFDAKNFTWTQFDLYGQLLFGEEEL